MTHFPVVKFNVQHTDKTIPISVPLCILLTSWQRPNKAMVERVMTQTLTCCLGGNTVVMVDTGLDRVRGPYMATTIEHNACGTTVLVGTYCMSMNEVIKHCRAPLPPVP